MGVSSKRAIFRSKALRHYAESRQKDVLPRLVSLPVFVFFWILLGLLLVSGITAWLVRVPTYIVASGIVLDSRTPQGQPTRDEAIVVVFLPVSRAWHVQAGQPILLQIGSTGTPLRYKVARVEPGILSPSDVRRLFGLNGATWQAITEPSTLLFVSLGPAFSTHQYAGSLVSAQLQIGSQRVLSLLPGLGQLIGG